MEAGADVETEARKGRRGGRWGEDEQGRQQSSRAAEQTSRGAQIEKPTRANLTLSRSGGARNEPETGWRAGSGCVSE